MIQVRNVPDDLHRALKARAAMEGRGSSDYILAELHVWPTAPPESRCRPRARTRASRRASGR